MCGKQRFSKKEAGTILNYIKKHGRKKNSKRKEKRYYFCDECNSYHLTSKNGYDI